MKILFIDIVHPYLIQTLTSLGYTCIEAYSLGMDEIIKQHADAQGIVIRSRFKLGVDFFVAMPQLQFIARFGAGMENIDVSLAKSKGIRCIHAPEGNRTALAEHALGMLLALMNNLMRADNEVRKHLWRREENRGYELEGLTVGIIGYGNMGSAFAQRLQGFGVKVLCYDKYKTNYINNSFCIESTLEQIQQEADVLSIHLPYNEETVFMIDASFIGQFAKSFYFINTSRGKIVRTDDVVDALKSGKLRGACLDVLEYETLSFESLGKEEPAAFTELKQMQQVVLSPHIAGWTHESNRKMAEVIAEKIQVSFPLK
jgi:D-3-phosphoglycerate dehydrogenase